jgi:hypothetical protein
MFISASQTFSDVKQMLSSYDSAGLISDSDLFRFTRYVVNQFGTYSTRQKSILIPIVGHKAQLPEDFSLVYAVYLCSLDCNEQGGVSRYKGYYGNNPVTYTLKDWYQSTCYDKCDVCFDGTEHYITRTIEKEFEGESTCKLNSRVPLSIDKSITKQKCDSCCINLSCKCEYSFHIIDQTIYTNFEEGYINLEYYALPVDEEGYPLIIDEPILEQAVEDYLIFKCFQKIYYNGDADVLQRVQYSEAKYKESLKEAIFFVKLPTWKSMVDYAKKRNNYLNLFNISSNSDYTNSNSNGNRIQQHSQGSQSRRF